MTVQSRKTNGLLGKVFEVSTTSFNTCL